MVLGRVLDLLDAGTLPKFSLDGQSSLLQDALALSPELMDRIAPHCQSGRLHIGPWFTMPDTQMPCLEALLRNLQRGMSDARKLGCDSFTGYLPDTFGQPAHMPMLLEKVGIHTAMVWRGVSLSSLVPNPLPEGEGTERSNPVFYWQSPNGSRVLTYALPEGYFHMPFQDVELETLDAKWESFKALESRLSVLDAPVFLPMGGDHLGPPSDDVLDAFGDQLASDYTAVHPHEFMDAVAKHAKETPLPNPLSNPLPNPLPKGRGDRIGALREWGEGCAPLLSGTLLSRPWLKYLNIKAEWMLTQLWEPLRARHAETLASAPSLFGKERDGVRRVDPLFTADQRALDHAWEQLMLNQPHDDLCGCSADSVHLQDEARYQSIIDAATTWIRWHKHELKQLMGEDVFLPVELPFNDAQRVTVNQRADTPPAPKGTREKTTLISDWQHDITQVPLSHRTETRYVFDAPVGGGPVPARQDVMQALKAFSSRLKIETFTDDGDSYNAAPRVASRQMYTPRFQPNPDTLSATATLKASQDVVTITLCYKGDGVIDVAIHQEIFTPNLQVNVVLNAPEAVTNHAYLTHGGFTPSTVGVPAPNERFKGYPADEKTVEWQAAGNAYHGALSWGEGGLIFPGHYGYELVEDHFVLPLSRGFDTLSGGRLPSRQVPAGPPFDVPQGQGIGRTLSHCFRVVEKSPLTETALQYHQHQLIMQPDYPAYPQKKLRSVVDSLVLQSNDVRITAHLYDPTAHSWTLRLLNTSNAPLTLNLPSACTWTPMQFTGHPLGHLPVQSLTISSQDWVSVRYVLS